jgi:hypothetical protein
MRLSTQRNILALFVVILSISVVVLGVLLTMQLVKDSSRTKIDSPLNTQPAISAPINANDLPLILFAPVAGNPGYNPADYAKPTSSAPLRSTPVVKSYSEYVSRKFALQYKTPLSFVVPEVYASMTGNCELVKHAQMSNLGQPLMVQISAQTGECSYGVNSPLNNLFRVGSPVQATILDSYTVQTPDGKYMTIVKQKLQADESLRIVAYNTPQMPENMTSTQLAKLDVIAIYLSAKNQAELDKWDWEKGVERIASNLTSKF